MTAVAVNQSPAATCLMGECELCSDGLQNPALLWSIRCRFTHRSDCYDRLIWCVTDWLSRNGRPLAKEEDKHLLTQMLMFNRPREHSLSSDTRPYGWAPEERSLWPGSQHSLTAQQTHSFELQNEVSFKLEPPNSG